MRNIWVIARREYKYYFISPLAYAVAFLFLLVLGWFFYRNITSIYVQSLSQPINPDIRMVIGPLVTILLFTMPALTMRSIAEENRMGTLEILLTAPVRDWELVIGKWLGSVLFLATLLAITWIYPIALNNMVDPGIDQGPLVTGMLGLLLMAASLIAIGVAISACFSNQIAAFFVSLVVVLVIWLVRPASAAVSGLGGQVLSYLNYVDHFLPFYQGVISVSDLVYFISITILGLVIGTVLVEVRRWR